MLRGTDISHYQNAIPAGDFTILKATEGLSSNDPDFSHWWKTLGSRGELRGAYHFAHPGNSSASEAAHFLSVVRAAGLKPGDMLVLDHETSGGSAAHDAAWARDWCARVESAVGFSPVVYTFLSFAREGRCAGLGDRPLWIADPSAPVGHPRVPAPWSKWVMHQYSETGGIDHDVFNGTRADWLALGGQHVTPHPDPTPLEDDMPTGLLTDGQNAVTPIALPRGKYKTIGFIADNGLEKLDPPKLRVAVHRKAGWKVEDVTVDSAKGQAVITFDDPATTDGISVRREDAGLCGVAFEVS